MLERCWPSVCVCNTSLFMTVNVAIFPSNIPHTHIHCHNYITCFRAHLPDWPVVAV